VGYAFPFLGAYLLDAFGGLHPEGGSPAMSGGAYWPNWKIARAATLLPDASGGLTLDGYGGLHPFGSSAAASGAAYFGFDIARDAAMLSSATPASPKGYVLDGYGGIHPFGGAPAASNYAYFPGHDIARRMVLLSDGSGGYVLDGWGGIHPFALGGAALPVAITNSAYFGFNIARDFTLMPGSTGTSASGFTLDGWGGLHPFSSAALPAQPGDYPYFPFFDIARSVRMANNATASNPQGWIIDGFGGVHSFGGAPVMPAGPYWPGRDLAVQLPMA
jgi:hypothetical protein